MEETTGDFATFKREDTEYILTKMFEVVGAEYNSAIILEPDWYLTKSWTPKEAAEFTKWLADYLKRRHKGVGKKKSMAEATWFVTNVGWAMRPTEEISIV